jgi:NitT/TauT family transport system substrate-binding protein
MRTQKRRITIVIFALLLATGSGRVEAQGSKEIIIGIQNFNFSYFPIYAAIEEGYYLREGFEIKLVLMRTAVAMSALISGGIGYAGGFQSPISGAIKGLPIRVIISTADRQVATLVVEKDIKRVEDLKGKVIATSSVGGSLREYTMRSLLSKYKLNLDTDVRLMFISGRQEDQMLALRRKQAHAIMVSPPADILLQREGYNLLLNAADHVVIPQSGLTTTLEMIRTQPEEVRKVLRATHKGLRFLKDPKNRSRAIEIAIKVMKLDPALAADIYDRTVPYLSETGIPTEEALRVCIEIARTELKVSRPVAIEDVTHFDLLKSAIRP